MPKVCALIPLRGGSKSIPDKNIKLIAGKPLCYWVLKAAYDSKLFTNIVVSTDSPKIANIVSGLDLDIEILKRPKKISNDTASTESVIQHFAQHYSFDIVFTIQATSPLLNHKDLQSAFKKFNKGKYDSLLTGTVEKRFYWDHKGSPLNYNPEKRPRRQDFNGTLQENGAFYITKKKVLESTNCRLGGKIGVYEMSQNTKFEIDEKEDWVIIESLLKKKTSIDYQKIRYLFCDVDGTLTDGGMYYSSKGEELKRFNTRDAKGLALLNEKGIEPVIFTSESSPIVKARAKKLKINHCYIGIGNKLEKFNKFLKMHNVSASNCAYIGDDINDFDCISLVPLSACPADAEKKILQKAFIKCKAKGGQGAVREFCNLILEKLK